MATADDSFQKESEEYLELLNRLGMKDRDESAHKGRFHRRFNFDSPDKTILLQIGETNCALFDVSVGGLSFNSEKQYEVGTRLELNFDGRFQVEVVIANSIRDEEVESGEEPLYQHGVRFVNSGDGYRCTRAVLDYYLQIAKEKF